MCMCHVHVHVHVHVIAHVHVHMHVHVHVHVHMRAGGGVRKKSFTPRQLSCCRLRPSAPLQHPLAVYHFEFIVTLEKTLNNRRAAPHFFFFYSPAAVFNDALLQAADVV
jgi:hypothetical protein